MSNDEPKLPKVSKSTFNRRRFIFQLFILGCIVGFGVLTFFAKNYAYFKFDLIITRSIQLIDFPYFDELMRFISQMGNPFLGTILILTFCSLLLLTKERKDAFLLFISVFGVTVLSILLKAFVSRPRPDPDLINQIGKYINSDSFPSGHVLHYMGLYGFLLFLAYTHLQKGILRRSVELFCVLIIFLGGVSRIYLGAHWFSDTLGSYLIGFVWLYIMIFIHNELPCSRADRVSLRASSSYHQFKNKTLKPKEKV